MASSWHGSIVGPRVVGAFGRVDCSADEDKQELIRFTDGCFGWVARIEC